MRCMHATHNYSSTVIMCVTKEPKSSVWPLPARACGSLGYVGQEFVTLLEMQVPGVVQVSALCSQGARILDTDFNGFGQP